MRWNRAIGGVAVAVSLATVVGLGHGQKWDSSRGGADRDGHMAGAAALTTPVVYWSERLGGPLSSGSAWVVGNGAPAAYVAFGGHVYAKTWGDSTSWATDLLGMTHIVARTDLDQDGTDDVIVAVSRDKANPALALLDLNGLVLWTAPREDLGPLSTGVRIVDLDNDGVLDLYVTPLRASEDGMQIVAYNFAAGVPQGAAMWKHYTEERDYFAGLYDVVGELDGDPGLEILALGKQHVYTYDAATGVLESESGNLGPLPYARVTLRPLDVDGDGVLEVLGYSNQAWAPPNNRRHVSLFAWSTDASAMEVVWSRDVVDVENDRISFADDSGIDLDGDGRVEVVFGVFDAASDAWTTEVRDAATGQLLHSIAGERFEATVASPLVSAPMILTHDDGAPLRAYSYDRSSGVTPLAVLGDLGVATCPVQTATLVEAPRTAPCVVNDAGAAVLVLEKTDATTGRVTGLQTVALADDSFAPLGNLDLAGGDTLSALWTIDAQGPARLAAARASGVIQAYDASLRVPPATIKPPYSWGGIPFGSKYSGADVPAYPLAVPGPPGGGERILTMSGAAAAMVLDAFDGGSIGGGATTVWTAGGATRAVVVETPEPGVSLFDSRGGIVTFDARTGDELWRVDDLFDPLTVALNADPLRVDLPDRDVSSIWFHRRDGNSGAYDLTVMDAATGDVTYFEEELDINNGGWRRMSHSYAADGSPVVYSGKLGEIWRFDGQTGAVSEINAVTTGTLTIPIGRMSQDPALLSVGLYDLSLIEPSDSSTIWQNDLANRTPRFGAVVDVGDETYYGTGEPDSPIFYVVDVSDGNIVARVALNDGTSSTDISQATAADGVLSNATAVDDLFGDGTPAWVIGSTDGHLYALDATTYELVWALYFGAAVGEVITADWDGDGDLELVASANDGRLYGIDEFILAAPEWVLDIDPPGGVSFDDVDTIRTVTTLYALWSEVEGAVSYEVAVFTNQGEMVSDGFSDVGNTLQAAIDELPLEVGARYVISVRAVSADGTSIDTVSDGVTVVGERDEPGTPTGGCCGVSGDGASGTLPLGILVALVLVRRPRRTQ